MDYGDIKSSDDENTSYDLATWAGTIVEAAPILDRVANSLRQSVVEIERFSRSGVDQPTLDSFLGRLVRRLRRAATRCGCRSLNVHAPSTRGAGGSEVGASGSCARRSSSSSTPQTFNDDNDDEAKEIGPS